MKLLAGVWLCALLLLPTAVRAGEALAPPALRPDGGLPGVPLARGLRLGAFSIVAGGGLRAVPQQSFRWFPDGQREVQNMSAFDAAFGGGLAVGFGRGSLMLSAQGIGGLGPVPGSEVRLEGLVELVRWRRDARRVSLGLRLPVALRWSAGAGPSPRFLPDLALEAGFRRLRLGARAGADVGEGPARLVAAVGLRSHGPQPVQFVGQLQLDLEPSTGRVAGRLGLGAAVALSQVLELTAQVGTGAGTLPGAAPFEGQVWLGIRPPAPRDLDGDGITGWWDVCPKAPESVNGRADEDGCPEAARSEPLREPDEDRDGVPDLVDACPSRAEDLDGVADEDGCPELDDDGDGVLDPVDACPQEPAGPGPSAGRSGCPQEQDADLDGVPDRLDDCPDEAEWIDGVEDEDGCPEPGAVRWLAGPGVVELHGTEAELGEALRRLRARYPSWRRFELRLPPEADRAALEALLAELPLSDTLVVLPAGATPQLVVVGWP